MGLVESGKLPKKPEPPPMRRVVKGAWTYREIPAREIPADPQPDPPLGARGEHERRAAHEGVRQGLAEGVPRSGEVRAVARHGDLPARGEPLEHEPFSGAGERGVGDEGEHRDGPGGGRRGALFGAGGGGHVGDHRGQAGLGTGHLPRLY